MIEYSRKRKKLKEVPHPKKVMNVDVWRKSLRSMKTSLLSSYELSRIVEEQELFQEAWESQGDIAFIGYKDNEGKRRIRDIEELIDRALEEIDKSDYKTAAQVYNETLRQVALYKLWARVLEDAVVTSGA
jgi:hypothetical protein